MLFEYMWPDWEFNSKLLLRSTDAIIVDLKLNSAFKISFYKIDLVHMLCILKQKAVILNRASKL